MAQSLDDMYKQYRRALNAMSAAAERRLIDTYQVALNRIRADIANVIAGAEGRSLAVSEFTEMHRLMALERKIAVEINTMMDKRNIGITESLSEMYGNAYYRTAWYIEMQPVSRQAGVILDWAIIPQDAVRAAILNPIKGLTLNDRLESTRRQIIRQIQSDVSTGLLAGDSYEDMAARLKDVLEDDMVKARRIVRTEGHRVIEVGTQDAMTEAERRGCDMVKVWMATLDDRTRDTHQEMDGQERGVDEFYDLPDGAKAMTPGTSGVPEEDINCRCTSRPQIRGFAPSARRVADGDGEVIPYMTYPEWIKYRIGKGAEAAAAEAAKPKTATLPI